MPIDSQLTSAQQTILKLNHVLYILGIYEAPFSVLLQTFSMVSAIASNHPEMLGPLVLGRLLPFAAGSSLLQEFIRNIYKKGNYMYNIKLVDLIYVRVPQFLLHIIK